MNSSCSSFLFLILEDFNWYPSWFGANCKQLCSPLAMQVALLTKSFLIHNTGLCKGKGFWASVFSLWQKQRSWHEMFGDASSMIFGRMLDEVRSCYWHLIPYQCQRFLEEFRRVCCSELVPMKPVPLMSGNGAAKKQKKCNLHVFCSKSLFLGCILALQSQPVFLISLSYLFEEVSYSTVGIKTGQVILQVKAHHIF